MPVSRVMSRDVVSIEPDADLEEVRKLILTHNLRRLPVVEGDKLIGMLSCRDILRVWFEL